MKDDVATVDFETRSVCNLRTHGTWCYSIDPTTEILCMAYRLPYWEVGRTALWHPAFPHLNIPESNDWASCAELIEWIQSGGLIEAHNVWFEVCIWLNILAPRFGWPLPTLSQWRCSAAKAASHALPRALDGAAAALALRERKDLIGGKVMKKITKPRKAKKKELETWAKAGVTPPAVLWHEDIDVLWQVWEYCRQDVITEEAVSHALPDLSEDEQKVFTTDLAMNLHGFQLDAEAVSVALRYIVKETIRLNKELVSVTGGVVQKATQRAQLLRWLATQDVTLFDTQKQTIDDILTSGRRMPDKARRALEILRSLGQSSTAKYQAMDAWMGTDARVRGGIIYHGASTGRWTGAGVQPQNFPKGKIKNMEALWVALKARTPLPQNLDVLSALSQGLRGAIVAGPSKQLFVADYASIEARVLVWLAQDEKALNLFRSGADIYCDMAGAIYNKPCNKAEHPDERALGKIAVLGLGYQMGATRFTESCALAGIQIDEDFAQEVVDAYRKKYWRVKQLWWDQEAAAIKAVQTKRPVMAYGITWLVEGYFLYAVLPSGRRLAYANPEIHQKRTPWDEWRSSLTFMGVDNYSRKWKRQTTYGGSIVENCLSGETPVLTRRGWIRLDRIELADRIWDGEEWVAHEGLIDRGWHATCILNGLVITPDHQILTTSGWTHAALTSELDWAPCRRPRYHRIRQKARQALVVARRMCGWSSTDVSSTRYSDDGRGMSTVSESPSESNDSASSDMGRDQNAMYQSPLYRLAQLWRAWDYSLQTLARFVRQFLGRHESDLSGPSDNRSQGQRWPVQPRELSMGDFSGTGSQYAQASTQSAVSEVSSGSGAWATCHIQPVLPGPRTRVYDLRNCGPRHRFVVAGGRIVHNCVQAISRDLMAAAILRCEGTPYAVVLSVHDELVAECPIGVGSVKEFEGLMAECPEWAKGCPVAAEGWTGLRYRK